MSQEHQSVDAQPSTPTTTIAQPTAPPPAQQQEPEWLPQRLERAKSSAQSDLLRTLGVQSVDDAKALVEAARKLEEERKTEAQRVAERIAALEPKAKQADDLASKLGRYAEAELGKLSEPQRAAVLAIAGEDRARALDVIEALRPTWASASTHVEQAQHQQVAAPRPPPASTSAATVAQSGAPAQSAQVDHKAEYERIRGINPVLASQYLLAHVTEIYPAQ